ncbi:Neuronal acetylcholine receptor subunit alpha-9-I (Nicotinic acetylcholine receptor subunit alpha-9-I) (NACHR alpha-9-I) [Durusdinium trenchii]|uniref:Neuronal acetylcholine receptor subunit alpha-9-I (Nicotinic acetylcholine receptor subunit alpha-9-I) (NACHR alpha-9-I) n=1 Tax=Durusdinium trenchii TaxID=1381693 RepID=A0ABP0K2U6_9DINO
MGDRDLIGAQFLEEPAWDHYFFPNYTFLNLVSTDGDAGCAKLQWCGEERGGFVEYARRYDAVFQETLELRRFPMDRQLCRIKLTAEADIQTFQLPGLFEKTDGLHECFELLHAQNHMQKKCTTYIRYADEKFPYPVQRSSVKTVLHLQRKGDYYFHNVLINIFLVNVIALFSFAVPVSDTGDRLSLLSTTLVAVTAYQTVINQSIPRKAYLTACDKYVIFAVIFQAGRMVRCAQVETICDVIPWSCAEDERTSPKRRSRRNSQGFATSESWGCALTHCV